MAVTANQRETVADLCHRQWAGWMDYMFSKAKINEDGSWTMPAEFVQRWQGQAKTPFSKLTDGEKDSDRTEADKFLSIIIQGANEA